MLKRYDNIYVFLRGIRVEQGSLKRRRRKEEEQEEEEEEEEEKQ